MILTQPASQPTNQPTSQTSQPANQPTSPPTRHHRHHPAAQTTVRGSVFLLNISCARSCARFSFFLLFACKFTYFAVRCVQNMS